MFLLGLISWLFLLPNQIICPPFHPSLVSLRSLLFPPLSLPQPHAHPKWGLNRPSLLRLYKSLVLSRLEYGCEVYSQVPPSSISPLNSIQNRALRIATGAFRSTPIKGLELLTTTLPLPLHFRYSQSCTFARLHTASSPALNSILHFQTPPSYWPFANSIYATYSEASIPLHSILPLPPPPVFPPPLPPPLDTCTSLSTLSKRNTPSPVLRAYFLAHSAKAHITIPVYTDGSRSPQSVGASAIFPDHSYSVALSSSTSSYSAELAAILIALHVILFHHPAYSFTIFTDSLSTIMAISSYSRPHPLLTSIIEYLVRLHSRHKTVTFCWVPAHCNVPGNKHADRCARLALSLPSPPTLPPTLSPSSPPQTCTQPSSRNSAPPFPILGPSSQPIPIFITYSLPPLSLPFP